ncbi:MAG: hypothetical protein IIX84_07635, partial [Oscillospiraceae bacterium]|nr:hypothetical protein [Oscillospiraceae bacterium]
YLLGIDVGTTGTKTLLFSEKGELIQSAYKGYETSMPKVGYSEQDPEDWWNAVCETVRNVIPDESVGNNVAGISMSVQGGTFVPVDAELRPTRPAIVWNDIRCTEELEQWRSLGYTDEDMYTKTGWHILPGLNAMQIRRMASAEPRAFASTKRFLSVPDYIACRMTGRAALDHSNIGINQLGNIREGGYDKDILAFAGISEDQLPEIVASGEVIGKITESAAEELGISPDAVLVSGAHDQYAVALGAGASRGGDILIGSGTCWVVTCIGDEPDFESGLSQSVAAAPGKWGTLWSLSSGGVCLEWLKKNIISGGITYAELDEKAEKLRAAEDGLFFFPFTGRANETSAFTKGSFIGLDLSHDRFNMARAVMEGVVFQICWMMEAFKAREGASGLKLAGGASKSRVWAQMLADVSGLPVRIPEVADMACVGAAILAGVGSGVFASREEGYSALAVGEKILLPDPKRTEIYRPIFEEYKRCARSVGSAYGI